MMVWSLVPYKYGEILIWAVKTNWNWMVGMRFGRNEVKYSSLSSCQSGLNSKYFIKTVLIYLWIANKQNLKLWYKTFTLNKLIFLVWNK
jgi:hypothetical protein